jgi:crotonobetainyl-CoA:carnitine CoA-transferase CaiB-like acyl-CoA transferase
MSGLRSITGYPGQPPVRAGISIADAVGGMFTAFGVTSALHERESSGRGQVVDTALYEGLFMLMNDFVAVYEALGVKKEPVGAKNPRVVPTNIYKTKDGEYVVPAAGSDPVFKRIASVMGRPDLAEKYGRAQVRADNEEIVDQEVADWIARHSTSEVIANMGKGDVPVFKVYRAPDILEDPQYKARDMLLPMEWPGKGTLHYPGIVPKLSRTPGSVRSFLPKMGEHNDLVYRQEMGLSGSEIASLHANGVI